MAAETEHSITATDRGRRREEVHLVPTVFLLAHAESSAAPRERFISFERELHVGRHAPMDASAGQAWVVRDKLVSGQHCVISKQQDGYQLTDLGSRNGTVVDGAIAHKPVKLRDGAIIFIGSQVALFRPVVRSELEAIRAELEDPLGPVPTMSPTFAAVCQTLRTLARSNCEILLNGETGSGKEVYARAIHQVSGRAGPFVAINCAALPRELVESELYGYARGAHSQARDSKRGLFEEAEGGTLFLDEIGDMPPDLQTKLLRFLQDREIMPLGATRSRKLDIRVLAATSRVGTPSPSGAGGIRPDLAARLGPEPIRIPPLRHRIEDLGELVRYFLGRAPVSPATADGDVAHIRQHPRFEPVAFQALTLYGWPGNIRELEKVVLKAELLSRSSEAIALQHLPDAVAAGPGRLKASPAGAISRPPPPSESELEELLQRFSGNVHRVARELGRTPPLVYRWCRRFQLDPEKFRLKD